MSLHVYATSGGGGGTPDDASVTNAKVATGAAIDAAKIADGSVSSAEFQRLDGVTSAVQTQIDAKQASDVDLTEIAGVSNVRGDLLVTDSTPNWIRLAKGSANTVLKSDGTDPAWGQVTNAMLATDPLARANHTGTQLAATVSDFDTQVATTALIKSLVDAKGDLVAATANDAPARLAAGVDFSEALVPDSSTATGLKWGLRRLSTKPTAALAETYPRMGATLIATASILATQRLNLVAIELPNGLVVTSITFVTGTTGYTAGSGTNHQIFGLFDDNSGSSSGTARALLRGTSDDGSTAWANGVAKTLTLTSTYTTTRTGLFYLGILIDSGSAGTLPTFVAVSTNSTVAGLAPVLCGSTAPGSLTALPNPAGAPTAQATIPYAYVS